jgi:4'-phosphopantetheinyl transferase
VAAGSATGQRPEKLAIDRTCQVCGQQHGKPELPGSGLHASVAHSGELVGVAITDIAPLGLDVESSSGRDEADLRHWTLTEAALKATGEGLRNWPNQPEPDPGLWHRDLAAAPGYVASLAGLGEPPADVREAPADRLLAEVTRRAW